MKEVFVLIEDCGDSHGFHGVFKTIDAAKLYVPKLLSNMTSGWWVEKGTGYSMANTDIGGHYIIYNDKVDCEES